MNVPSGKTETAKMPVARPPPESENSNYSKASPKPSSTSIDPPKLNGVVNEIRPGPDGGSTNAGAFRKSAPPLFDEFNSKVLPWNVKGP
jgi:hypothetical protein